MKREQVLIFANPIAGKGKAKRIAAVLEEELKKRGYVVKVFLNKPSDSRHAHEYMGMAPWHPWHPQSRGNRVRLPMPPRGR